tara:strand:- start:600 stop:1163 length:564 start_codon:yes stop_codon:yes gene_type:complete
MRDCWYHFVDTETSSLSPFAKNYKGEILELAIYSVHGKTGEEVDRVWRVKPEHIETAHPRSLEVNGYTEEGWSKAVPFFLIREEVAEILSEGVLVGHSLAFDLRFIRFELQRAGWDGKLSHLHICTRQMVVEHTDFEKTSLDYCRSVLPLTAPGRAHSALKDAKDCAALFFLLASEEGLSADSDSDS